MTRLWVWMVMAAAAIAGFGASYYWTRSINAQVIVKTQHPYFEEDRVFHYPLDFIKSVEKDPHAGKKVYQEYCISCHAQQAEIPLRAPRLGIKKDWVSYQNLTMDVLFKLVAQGVGAMPARGGCFECSDALLKKTITYMLEQSK